MTWIIKIDYENNAEDFWTNIINSGLQIHEPIVFETEEQAQKFYDFCKTIPGFSEGPNYAKTALFPPIKQDAMSA